MAELLIETYGVKSICFVNDALSSYYFHNQQTTALDDGLVVSFGSSSCTVIPVCENAASFSAAKRF
jgi:actin-related protein